MVDIMNGPNGFLEKAFKSMGWRVLTVDVVFGKDHDLSRADSEEDIGEHFNQAATMGQCWVILASHV